MKILKMGSTELLTLVASDISFLLSPEEVVHIAKVLGAFWAYDYEASKQGRVGLHALLKSGLHSDGFFVSRIMLAQENIRQIVSAQIVMKLMAALPSRTHPNFVAGVPDGATRVGEDVAKMLGSKNARMRKVRGQMVLETEIKAGQSILFVEDFCTRGTGIREAFRAAEICPTAKILPYVPVVINRGGLRNILVEGIGDIRILPIVEWRIRDWSPESCPLCAAGSRPIKPKATDENWRMLTRSQQ